MTPRAVLRDNTSACCMLSETLRCWHAHRWQCTQTSLGWLCQHGLSRAGPLLHGLCLNARTACPPCPRVPHPQLGRGGSTIYATLHKGLERPWILVPTGSWNQPPSDTEGQLQSSSWGTKGHMQTYGSPGLSLTPLAPSKGRLHVTLPQRITCKNNRSSE